MVAAFIIAPTPPMRNFLKHVILLVNIAFVALMLMSGAAYWMNPAKHTLIAILGLCLPILLLINLAFTIWWIAWRDKLFIISLAAMLPFVPRYLDFPQSDGGNAPNEQTIRIITYNTHNFGLSMWPKHKETMADMMEFIKCENIDIACFQEYSNGERDLPTEAGLHKIFRYSHTYYTMNTWNRGDTRSGLATYTNHPIVGQRNILSDGETSNAIISTDVKIGDDTIRIFNCHLQSNKFTIDEYSFIEKVNTLDSDVYDKSKIEENRRGLASVYHRMQEAYEWRVRQALTLARQAEESPYPVIICGDFNETQSSYIYRLVSKRLNDSQRITKTGWGNTYRRFAPGIRIDYILYDNPLKCRSCNVPQVDFSDHRPVVGEYAICR